MGNKMDRADMAIAALRQTTGAELSADQVQALLDVAARLLQEQSIRYPHLDHSEALDHADQAAECFRSIELVEPAYVLHAERVAAAKLGGVL